MTELTEKKLIELDLKKKINTDKIKNLDMKNKPSVLEVTPLSLINYRRFDIMAKYIYAWFKEYNIESGWGLRVYDEHIRVFNNYDEGDGSQKKGIRCFVESFDSTLESIKEKGFDENITLIPIGINNEPLDGAHRVAAAILYNKSLKVIKFNNIQRNYNYSFFTERGLDSIDTKFSDAMAYEYCKKKNNTYIVILFPAAVGKREETKGILRRYGDIFYEKDIIMGNQGPRNLIIQLYRREQWIGTFENGYLGASGKVEPCFNRNGPVSVIFFETEDSEKILFAKEEIRALYNIGKHSVHINDTHEETIELAQLFLNENSIYFLNNARPYSNKKFYNLLNTYKEIVNKQKVYKEYFCLGCQSVMSAFGMQGSSKLDVICYGNSDFLEQFDIVDINKEMRYYPTSKDDIIFNPENHFYFDGIKFISIDLVRKMKGNRGQTKDKRDIKIINKYLKGESILFRLRVSWLDTKKLLKKIIRKMIKLLYGVKQYISNN